MDLDEFKRVYQEEGSKNLGVQIPFLRQLAEQYENIARHNPRHEWTNILKAHALYNSCATRCTDATEKDHYTQQAFKVQNLYLKYVTGQEIASDKLKELQASHLTQLQAIRENAKENIKPVAELIPKFELEPQLIGLPSNDQVISDCVDLLEPAITGQSDRMIDLAGKIIKDAVALMNKPLPCDFDAVALGSMARGESTPYSDLEFLFLLERKDDPITEYFQTLAMIVYFLIGNLQETKLKYMAIDELSGWFTDEAKSGFKIDGLQQKAGNIPTGNGCSNPKNKFICTVNELTDYYRLVFDNPPDEQDGVTGDDSDMLAFTRVIYSTSYPPATLTNAFRKAKHSMKPNVKRQLAIDEMLQSDLIKYELVPPEMAVNKTLILAKTDIYRYTSLLLLNLGIMYAETSWSSMTTIYQLYIDDIIDKRLAHCLQTALLLAMYIRLSCYLHHDSQQEDVNVVENIAASTDAWFLPKSLFIMYFSVAAEVKHSWANEIVLPAVCRCESAMSVALCYHDQAAAKSYGDYLISINQLQNINGSLQLLIVAIYHNQQHFGKALDICQSILELPENTLDEGYRFLLNTKIWTIMLEINNPNAEFYLKRIKKSPLLLQHSLLCTLVGEAYGTIVRMRNSEGGHIRIDTQFMEEALLAQDPSNNAAQAFMYAWIHSMNNKTLLAIEWAERSLDMHKEETGVGVETVTMTGLVILAFLALKEYDRGSIDKSEEYAKRALVIDFQIEPKPPKCRADMYGLLTSIYGKRGNKRMADAFRTHEEKYRSYYSLP